MSNKSKPQPMDSDPNRTKILEENTAVESTVEENTVDSMPDSRDSLPKDVVHCFPAHRSVIIRRRILSILFGLVFLAASVFFILPASISIVLFLFAIAGFIASVLVFIQSFLIASYRVALDYERSEVVLRYQFQKIRISFDDFDTREGQPDRTQAALSSLPLTSRKVPAKYLILDNVRDSACYQTANKDLASDEDFYLLKQEAENIRNAYRGKPEDSAAPLSDDDEISRIIKSALPDTPKNIDE